MNQQQERDALEKLLGDATILSRVYSDRMKSAQTQEQSAKVLSRLARYEAIRTLIGDLMLG